MSEELNTPTKHFFITPPSEGLGEASSSEGLGEASGETLDDAPVSIGIYGGTFNPLHNGHIALAKAFLQQANLDEVWFVVSPQNPFKVNQDLLDDNLRLRMVRETLHGIDGMAVSDIEFHLPKPSYMYNTLCHLTAKYPKANFTLLIGGDNWKAFDRWKNADEIVKNYKIAVYPRRGDKIDVSSLPTNVMLLSSPLLDISSTEIRSRVHDNLPINDLVPPKIAEFIEKYGLYK